MFWGKWAIAIGAIVLIIGVGACNHLHFDTSSRNDEQDLQRLPEETYSGQYKDVQYRFVFPKQWNVREVSTEYDFAYGDVLIMVTPPSGVSSSVGSNFISVQIVDTSLRKTLDDWLGSIKAEAQNATLSEEAIAVNDRQLTKRILSGVYKSGNPFHIESVVLFSNYRDLQFEVTLWTDRSGNKLFNKAYMDLLASFSVKSINSQ